MQLIVVVVALLIERTLSQVGRLRRLDVFATYIGWLEKSRPGRWWLAHPVGILVIVPPLSLMGAAQWFIDTHAWLAIQLLFGLVGLWISFGPRDLWEDVYALANARNHEQHDEVMRRAMALCRRATGARSPDIAPATIVGAVLVQAHERVLGVLLWYMVAGPTGAVFYRLVRELPALAMRDPATRMTARAALSVHGLAAWVPAHIVVLVYALVGRTRCSLALAWRSRRATGIGIASVQALLASSGRGALGLSHRDTDSLTADQLDDMLMAALSLISRAVLVLLAMLAILVLAGWIR